jgi:hypothetical protein
MGKSNCLLIWIVTEGDFLWTIKIAEIRASLKNGA